MSITISRPKLFKDFSDISNLSHGIGPQLSIAAGSPVVDNTYPLFGVNTLKIPSTGQVSIDNTDDTFNFGTSDFAVEFWAYLVGGLTSAASMFGTSIVSGSNQYGGIQFLYNGNLLSMSSNGTSFDICNGVSLGTAIYGAWVHWELNRSGNNFYVFKNGSLMATFSSSAAIYYNSSNPTKIGSIVSGTNIRSMSQLRVIKGTCLHTSSFTPPSDYYTLDPLYSAGYENNIMLNGLRSTPRYGSYLINTNKGAYGKTAVIKYGSFMKNILPFGAKSNAKLGYLSNIDKIGNISVRRYVGAFHEKAYTLRKVNKIFNCQIIAPKLISILKPVKPVKIVTPSTGFGSRSKNRSGYDARTFQVDSNAGYVYDVLITPTHQYQQQLINLSANVATGRIGRWQFKINDFVTVPTGVDAELDSISFLVNLDTLSFGENYCKLELLYQNGELDYIPLRITKESNRRTVSERTFRYYDGGYLIEGTNVFRRAIVANNLTDGVFTNSNFTITTTDETSINLLKYISIINFDAVGDGCKILFSFDGRNTWKAFDGSIWNTIAPENIATYGMSVEMVKSLDYIKLGAVFTPTQLDYKIYNDINYSGMVDMNKLNSSTTLTAAIGALNSGITVYSSFDMPVGFNVYSLDWTQSISNLDGGAGGRCNLLITTNKQAEFTAVTNTGCKATFTGTYYPPPGETITKIRVSATALAMYGAANSKVNISTYPLVAGISKIVANLSSNLPPTIQDIVLSPSIVHKETSMLSGVITDLESDKVQYRITINGTTELQPWTSFADTPITFNIPISYTAETVGTNLIRIEATDGDKSTIYDTYITQTNNNPYIAGVLNGLYLSATAGDADNDTIKYRILFNGNVKVDWTNFFPSPVSLTYKINRREVKLGEQNSLVVEVMDDLGSTGSCIFDFVGVDTKKRYAFIT